MLSAQGAAHKRLQNTCPVLGASACKVLHVSVYRMMVPILASRSPHLLALIGVKLQGLARPVGVVKVPNAELAGHNLNHDPEQCFHLGMCAADSGCIDTVQPFSMRSAA